MKKFILSAVICLASSGVFASNEVTNSEKIEETNNLDIIVSLDDVDYNCRTTFSVMRNGTVSEASLFTNAGSQEDCIGKAKEFANVYLAAGYEVSDQVTIFG